jgi:CBS domain-containing protein
MNVSHILATKGSVVVTIGTEQSVREAIRLLNQKNIGSLVVLDDGRNVAGLLSERDIILQLGQRDDVLSQKVHEVMTTQLITALPEDDLHSLANKMTENRVRHLPIVTDGQLIGIVSIGDVLKAQRDLYKGEVDTLESQIMAEQK